MNREDIIIRSGRPEDSRAITEVYQENRDLNDSEEERAKRGFIQGSNDLTDQEARFAQGIGNFVAVAPDQKVVGTVFFSQPKTDDTAAGPTVILKKCILSHDLDPAMIRVYGPLAVAEGYKGMGIARRLIDAVAEAAKAEGASFIAAIVDEKNVLSKDIHDHWGFQAVYHYENERSRYIVYMLEV